MRGLTDKAVDWLENSPDSPYRLDRTRLRLLDTHIDGEPVTYFSADYPRSCGYRLWMFSFKEDIEPTTGMHWTPPDPDLPLHDNWMDWHYD